jgi:hypothetical protein
MQHQPKKIFLKIQSIKCDFIPQVVRKRNLQHQFSLHVGIALLVIRKFAARNSDEHVLPA